MQPGIVIPIVLVALIAATIAGVIIYRTIAKPAPSAPQWAQFDSDWHDYAALLWHAAVVSETDENAVSAKALAIQTDLAHLFGASQVGQYLVFAAKYLQDAYEAIADKKPTKLASAVSKVHAQAGLVAKDIADRSHGKLKEKTLQPQIWNMYQTLIKFNQNEKGSITRDKFMKQATKVAKTIEKAVPNK